MMTLTHEELRRLLAAVDLKAPFGPRDYLLIVLDYNTGLRVAELAGLNVGMVSHQSQPRETLHVTPDLAKYSHSRLVPLNRNARTAVSKLLNFNRARGLSVAPEAPLLQTRFHERMTVRAIQRLLESLRNQAGIDFQATPRTLRHTFASDVVRNTGNIRIVRDLIGHQRLNTVAIYTHPRRDELARAVETLAQRG